MPKFTYHDNIEVKDIKRLRQVIAELPPFVKDFFRGIEPRTTAKTRLGYAYDLRTFFHYLKKSNPTLKNTDIKDFPLELLEQLTVVDLEEYQEYLKEYSDNEQTHMNREAGRYRKISCLKSFYDYLLRTKKILINPAHLLLLPKIREKEIVRLEPDETASLLDYVERGVGESQHQQLYREKNRIRDMAIVTLLLGTGIRVSECVGLDLAHLNLDNNELIILRKGRKEATIYFGNEVHDALEKYMEERVKITPLSGHESALFLSMQRKRIAVRSVETMVKNYTATVTPLKTITPHKLRSTYGTTLYQETGDIYLVADVLGHVDVNTTKTHYSAMGNNKRRSAANIVKLREK